MGKSLAWLIAIGLVVSGCSTPQADTPSSVEQQGQGDVAVEGDVAVDTSNESSAAVDSSPKGPVTLAVVGDIMLARGVGNRIDRQGAGAVLAGVRDDLLDADLTVGSLESPVGEGGDPANKAYTFLAETDTIDVLTDGSFDVVSLANNHILDHGIVGMTSTEDLLDDAGIKHVGSGADDTAAHAPVFVETQGMRIAFLGYLNTGLERGGFATETWAAGPDQPGVAWGDPERVAEDVERASAEADHVIVLLHSGTENTEQLGRVQQSIGNAALDAGAVAVLGAHPHQLQGWERRDTQFVVWSLGNFVFDFANNSPGSTSTILKLTLDDQGVSEVDWTPVEIVDGFPQTIDSRSERTAAAEAIEALEIR